MSLLTDRDVLKYIDQGQLEIEAGSHEGVGRQVRGCSVNLHLGDTFFVPDEKVLGRGHLDDLNVEDFLVKTEADNYVLGPGESVCARTLEDMALPSNIAGIYKARFRYRCLGVIADGVIHPGSRGPQLLAIHNAGRTELSLAKGMSVCQLLLFKTEHPCLDWYGALKLGDEA